VAHGEFLLDVVLTNLVMSNKFRIGHRWRYVTWTERQWRTKRGC